VLESSTNGNVLDTIVSEEFRLKQTLVNLK